MKANPRLKVNPGKEKSKSKVSDKIFLKNVNCLVIKLDSEFSLIQDWFIESRLSDQMTAARTCTLPSIQIKKAKDDRIVAGQGPKLHFPGRQCD